MGKMKSIVDPIGWREEPARPGGQFPVPNLVRLTSQCTILVDCDGGVVGAHVCGKYRERERGPFSAGLPPHAPLRIVGTQRYRFFGHAPCGDVWLVVHVVILATVARTWRAGGSIPARSLATSMRVLRGPLPLLFVK